MKSNKIMKKSLSIGLAVAMAVSSMSVSGGLMNPTAVYADEIANAEAVDGNTLTGTVTITGIMKFGEAITVDVAGAPEDAKLSYQFLRVKGDTTTEITRTIGNKYKLTKEDIGATIKVEITAKGYEGKVEATAAEAVAKGDAIRVIGVTATKENWDASAKTYTYSLEAVTDNEAAIGKNDLKLQYAMAERSVQISDLSWQDSNTFSGLIPDKVYSSYAKVIGSECYKDGTEYYTWVTVPKLQRAPLTLTYTVEDLTDDSEGNDKKVSITEIQGVQYTFDGGESWSDTATKSFKMSEGTSITIGIKYDDTDANIYVTTVPIYQQIDISKESQTALDENDLILLTAPNSDKTAYNITATLAASVTDEVEYSTDGNTYKLLDDISELSYAYREKTITLYARKAATDTANASPAIVKTVTTAAESKMPTIEVLENGPEEKATVTLTVEGASAGTEIFYTLDGENNPDITEGGATYKYTEPFEITEKTVIRAIAVEPDKIKSGRPEITTFTGTAVISGLAIVGETLTASLSGLNVGAGTSSYQWYRGEEEIAGATDASYTVTSADAGKTIKVKIKRNGYIAYHAKISAPTDVVISVEDADKEVLTGTVAISGTSKEGETLTASLSGLNAGAGTPSYQWYRGEEEIAGATDALYTVTSADVGKTMKVVVIVAASDTVRGGTIESAPTEVVARKETSNSSSSSGGSGSIGGSTTTPNDSSTATVTETKPDGTIVVTTTETKADGTKAETVTETKPDGSIVETVTEIKPDGSKVETTITTATDGSVTKIVKADETNSAGKKVAVTTTTKIDANGKVTSESKKYVIENVAKNTTATITVKTDKNGEATVTVSVTKTGSKTENGTKAAVSAAVVSQITEVAGTTDVMITQKVTDTDGKTKYTVKVNAEDLIAGENLKIMKVDPKTGKYVLVDAKNYKVTDAGNVTVTMDKNGTYILLNEDEADAQSKAILRTVKVKDSSKSVKAGKKTQITVKAENKSDNVKKITYTTSNKSVATVNKNGKITTKQKGTVTVKAKVTLKNGKTKTVSMKVKVK